MLIFYLNRPRLIEVSDVVNQLDGVSPRAVAVDPGAARVRTSVVVVAGGEAAVAVAVAARVVLLRVVGVVLVFVVIVVFGVRVPEVGRVYLRKERNCSKRTAMK